MLQAAGDCWAVSGWLYLNPAACCSSHWRLYGYFVYRVYVSRIRNEVVFKTVALLKTTRKLCLLQGCFFSKCRSLLAIVFRLDTLEEGGLH